MTTAQLIERAHRSLDLAERLNLAHAAQLAAVHADETTWQLACAEFNRVQAECEQLPPRGNHDTDEA
jgi:hypothetical protein